MSFASVVSARNIAALRQLVEAGQCDVNQSFGSSFGETALINVARTKGAQSKEFAALLLEGRAAVDMQDTQGYTALARAVTGNRSLLGQLIEARASVDIRTAAGETALILAPTHMGSTPVLKTLLQARGSVNAQSDIGDSALMKAADKGDEDAVSTLYAAGAEVDARDGMGYTALMRASGFGHRNVVGVLVRAGAALEAENAMGDTALDIGSDYSQSRAVAAIEEASEDLLNTTLLTLHLCPELDGTVSVVCTSMSGDELASLRMDAQKPIRDLRAAVASELLQADLFRLGLPDGTILVDDDTPLSKYVVAADCAGDLI